MVKCFWVLKVWWFNNFMLLGCNGLILLCFSSLMVLSLMVGGSRQPSMPRFQDWPAIWWPTRPKYLRCNSSTHQSDSSPSFSTLIQISGPTHRHKILRLPAHWGAISWSRIMRLLKHPLAEINCYGKLANDPEGKTHAMETWHLDAADGTTVHLSGKISKPVLQLSHILHRLPSAIWNCTQFAQFPTFAYSRSTPQIIKLLPYRFPVTTLSQAVKVGYMEAVKRQ